MRTTAEVAPGTVGALVGKIHGAFGIRQAEREPRGTAGGPGTVGLSAASSNLLQLRDYSIEYSERTAVAKLHSIVQSTCKCCEVPNP